jgi:hypothetical protein
MPVYNYTTIENPSLASFDGGAARATHRMPPSPMPTRRSRRCWRLRNTREQPSV